MPISEPIVPLAAPRPAVSATVPSVFAAAAPRPPAAPAAVAPPPAAAPAPAPAAAAAPAARPSPPAGAVPPLVRKLQLEAAMFAQPQDRALRASYFELLGRIGTGHTGLLTALLPELGAPLYFRAGTPDIAVLADVFRDHALAFEMRPTPLRILVIGAYAGYSSVELARRFPRAQVLAVEPLADNFRLLSLNAAPWRQIRLANVAAWHHAGRLAPAVRVQADWSVRLNDEAEAAERTIPALPVQDILARAGWPGADLIVCDATGAEREIFADPLAPWLPAVDAVFVRLHEQAAPRATEWVTAALDATVFERRKVGEIDLFVRRVPRQALPPTAPELPLLRGEPGLAPFALSDTPATSFGFFIFDGSNCQLHPNSPGGKPSRAVFVLRADGQRRFVAGIQHAGHPSGPVMFGAGIQREDGSLAGHAEVVLQQRETGRLTFDCDAPLHGTVRVILQTAMAPGAHSANFAWARWLNPKLV